MTVSHTYPTAAGVPDHLPTRLAITLWDFSWYTRCGQGEPYEDIDAAVADAASLGYNAIRICAAPMLMFGGLGVEDLARDLRIEGLGRANTGGYYGQRTRWYDAPGGYSINLYERLEALFAAARRHGMVIMLASWEYQQATAFAASSRWWEAIDSVPLEKRPRALATAWDGLIRWLDARGHRDRIAMVELHNEVDFSMLPPMENMADALTELRAHHSDLVVTASYGKPPHLEMYRLPESMGAIQCHVYSYGVLDALQDELDIRGTGMENYPGDALAAMLVKDSPSPQAYGAPIAWKMNATVVTDRMIYGYDWLDADAWDTWLYSHYGEYRAMMIREITSRTKAIARAAHWRGVPAVIGEGWVGYTPLHGTFEEGPGGRALVEAGVETALAEGAWGMVLCSNAAPHHPMWEQRAWQIRLNAKIRAQS
ncbi:cellulase-like family protein [Demequina muriae]|uniref:Cellulase-like family protein n=1 Tax=Demequina muriae TaxID=3051664 RepID=A0ABT8GI00_9MICO|nr:cellulase-like family protein [Demequina sp. EGI L300058]MDN4481062.1 cellulase-like family protein [Demequina sp. EGI L300058]